MIILLDDLQESLKRKNEDEFMRISTSYKNDSQDRYEKFLSFQHPFGVGV